ncbi:MAG TPA: class I SAM-dependent methyltransferase [Alphaproteobacteria bacterium]|nr:class I SAM-dependent methyltransferase [Alphaproteobacteria bacterium]
MEYLGADTVLIRCLLCGSASDSTLLFYRGYRIARCLDCNFIFVNPRPTEQALLRLYSNQQANPFLKRHFEALDCELPVLVKIIGKIQKYLPSGKLLEIGCGRGDFLRVAQLHGFSVTGCDIFGGCMPVIDDTTFYDGTLKDAKFADCSFDIVVIRNTLEHLFNPNIELEEIMRILKPGGYLYTKVPNVEFEYGFRCRLLYRRNHHFEPPYHLNYFNQASFYRLITNAQFDFLTWILEEPTRHRKWTKNLLRKTGYRFIQASYLLSGGKMFPKPVLACLSRKESRGERRLG